MSKHTLHLPPTENVHGLTPLAVMERAGMRTHPPDSGRIEVHATQEQATALMAEWSQPVVKVPHLDLNHLGFDHEVRVEPMSTGSVDIQFVIEP